MRRQTTASEETRQCSDSALTPQANGEEREGHIRPSHLTRGAVQNTAQDLRQTNQAGLVAFDSSRLLEKLVRAPDGTYKGFHRSGEGKYGQRKGRPTVRPGKGILS